MPAPQPLAAPAQPQSARGAIIVGDEGVVCATAIKAPADTLPAVISACGRIQAKQPTEVDRARVLRYRGVAYQRTGNLQAAIADFDQVLQRTPDDTWAVQGRAEALESLGQWPQAIEDYRRLAALRPGDTRWRIKIAELGATPPTPSLPTTPTLAVPPVVAAAPPPSAPPATEPPAAPSQEALVRELQASLRELGYDVGAINGLVGDKTREAIDRFAADVGLPRGGDPDEELLGAAEDQLRYRRELAAEEQRALAIRAQQALADLGYDIGDIDGVIGARSRGALRAWSSIRGRPVTEVNEEVVVSLEDAVVERLAAPEAPSPQETTDAPTAAAPSQAPKIVFDEFEADVPTAPPVEAPGAPTMADTPGTPPQVPAAEPPPAPAVTRSAGGYDIVAPGMEAPEKRVALVIGNGGYQAVTPLVNPKNDADDVSAALSELGFEVLKGVDLSREAMTRITKDFARRTRTADIAMAYYSGHGMQFERTNYLVPVDVQIQDEYDLREMVELSQVIQDTGQAKKLALVVVDACRDDPLATKVLAQSLGPSRSTSLGQGLAAPKLPTSQSLIAYATAADFVAYDGGEQSRNSPFTAALLKNIRTPKLDVRQLFGKVSDAVRKETGNAQRPDMWTALGGDPIYLVPGLPDPVGLEMSQLTASEVQVIQRSLKWLKFWSGAEDGVATPELTFAVSTWQRSLFVEDTGRLTPQQVVALHRTAARERPRAPLPAMELGTVMAKLGQGDAEAKRVMGIMFDPAFADGPFAKDRNVAKTYYEQAAAQGDKAAAGLLGEMLVAPDNPTPNRADAMKWLETAAQAGDPNAALRIAELLLERQVDAAGRSRAVSFLQIAAVDPDTSGMANALLRHAGQAVGK